MIQAMRATQLVCVLLSVVMPGLSGCGAGGDVPSGGALVNTPGSNAGNNPEPANQPPLFNGPVRQVLGIPGTGGDIYVFGDFTAYGDQSVAQIVRVRPDGSLHAGFVLPASLDRPVSGIALAADGTGDLYIADSLIERGVSSSVGTGRIWRVHADGSVDATFAMGTINIETDAFPPDPEFRPVVRSLAPLGDGRVYVAAGGRYNGTPVGQVMRINRNGSPDTGFTAQTPYPVYRVIPTGDGSGDVYIGTYERHAPGSWDSRYLLRLNGDGTVDAGFDTAAFIWAEARIEFMIPVGDGSGDLFARGSFLDLSQPNPGGPFALRGLVRIDPNGAIDRTSPRPQVDPLASVVAMVMATDGSGDWFVGQRTAIDRFQVLRYRADGLINPSFPAALIIGNELHALTPAPDGSGDLFIGGDFQSYNGAAVSHLIRVNSNGTVDSGRVTS
jgi:hypothetical protein